MSLSTLTMRSARLPRDLTENQTARAVRALRARGGRLLDLTESNPTRVGLAYSSDLLAPLADPRGLTYNPAPLGLSEARQAVAQDYARRGLRVDPSAIALTASTSEAYSLIFKLLCDAQPPGPGSGAGPPGVAVEAAPDSHPAVPVGAGKPGVQGDLLDPDAEALSEMGVEIAIG